MQINQERIPKSNFFKYFEKCYEADNNRFTVENIGQAKYQYKHFLKGQEELMTGKYPLIPLFHKKQDELLTDIALYKLEKQLYYATFFILGNNEGTLSKNKNLFAPLVLFPASIEVQEDETAYLQINKQEGIINRAVLNKLTPVSESSSVEDFFKDIEGVFYDNMPDAFLLKRYLDKHFCNVNTEELMYYPEVWSQYQISKYLKNKEEGVFKVVPAAVVSLVPKVNNALKVITDLKKIGEQSYFGKPITDLIDRKASVLVNDVSSVLQHQLNKDQFAALQHVQKYHNSVVIGPPGTGKSYTICAMAVDCILRGESVLIVSKTKSAVEVLRSMLIKEYRLDKYLVHTSGHSYKRSLEAKLSRLLGGIYGANYLGEKYDEFKRDENYLKELEEDFLKRVTAEVELGELNNKTKKHFVDFFKKLYIKSFTDLDETLWDLFFDIERMTPVLRSSLKKYILEKIDDNVKKAVQEHRFSLVAYYDALKSNSFSQYKRKVDTIIFEHVFKAFPIWLAHLPELNAVLPTQKGLFDVVIIDEATQCDIASALPAIYRAKRSVIVGDPKQLRHYSFLSRSKQQQLRKELELPDASFFNYRDKSILDIYMENIESQDQVSFLREHFRSPVDIIEFSNKTFYDSQLEVLKVTPDVSKYAKQILIPIEKGERDKSGINEAEADVLLAKLDEIIQQHKERPITIGVLSLFSDQVTYLKKLLKLRYELTTLKKFDILCATPYEFQGNERDVMLISLALDNDSHHSAFRHINKPDVLNVAITRARQLQYVFSSLEINKLDGDSLLYKFLNFWNKYANDHRENIAEDTFQKAVYDKLLEKGYEEVLVSFPLGGQILDLLVIHKGKKVFVDLIGDKGDFSDHFSLERYKTFARIGILSFPLHYSFWKKYPGLFFDKLEKLFS